MFIAMQINEEMHKGKLFHFLQTFSLHVCLSHSHPILWDGRKEKKEEEEKY